MPLAFAIVGKAEARATEVIMVKRESDRLEDCLVDTADMMDGSLFVDIMFQIYN
ncbi:hypothetical protein VSU01S_25420 [Vibrio superstes NBRC 103154]|uniref:Uncharacterized protein n=1 Tax=Vibrio superstes NBRC 103154 TaxID=1219062 RepID=A0A511QTC3_9VIBR|nr:hypothetical protein VSU01S_25420 [Vibrio superstes NBRC 103154]